MNILIAYGSTEGHTRKIAQHIKKLVEESGHQSLVMDCAGMGGEPEMNEVDAFVVAGSVHNGEHQSAAVNFVKGHLDLLKTKPSAFISVSLSASLDDGQSEAQKYVSDFLRSTGWQPQAVHLAAGAIRFLEYDFFKKFTVEYMVLKGKQMPDPSAGNPEYTDWAALEAFITKFIGGNVAG